MLSGPRRELLAEIDIDNPYVALQLAQTELMRRSGAAVKLGWSLPRSGRDEVGFDSVFARTVGTPLSTVYTVGGRSLDARRPRACPYLCRDPRHRVLIAPGERVRIKLAHAAPTAARGYERLLGKIARAEARLAARPAPRDPIHAVQNLLDRVTARLESGGA
jgi:hypothetical protein